MSNKTMVTIAVAAMLGLSGWAGSSIITLYQRVTAVEARTVGQGEVNDDLRDWLRRIERKLDRILERHPSERP